MANVSSSCGCSVASLRRRVRRSRHGAGEKFAATVQGQQQRSLQEAHTHNEIGVKRGRQGIAVIGDLHNGAAGLADTGVVDCHSHQPPRTPIHSFFKQRCEQRLRLPFSPRVQEVFARPTVLFTPIGPTGYARVWRGPAPASRPMLGVGRAPKAGIGKTRYATAR